MRHRRGSIRQPPLPPGCNRTDNRHIAIWKIDRLPRPDRLGDDHGWYSLDQLHRCWRSRRAFLRFRFRDLRIEIGCRLSAPHRRRHAGTEERRPCIFETSDPDAAANQILKQLHQLRALDRYIFKIENDRTIEKEPNRTRCKIVQLVEPAIERQFRRKDQRQKGPSFQADWTRLC